MEQLNISLPDDKISETATHYFNEILSVLKNSNLGYDLSHLQLTHREPESGDAYDTILLFNHPCFHIKGKKSKYIYFNNSFERLLKNTNVPYEPSNGSRWARSSTSSFVGFSEIPNLVEELYEIFLRASDSFGCCGSYLECSNVGHCIKTDIMFSGKCAYRQNLKAGRIFYGVNKNI